MTMTPSEALDAIQSRLEAYEASVARLPDYMSPEMTEAIGVLHAFIKQGREWGEPGDCVDRINDDDDLRDEIRNELNAVSSAKDSLRVGDLEAAEAALDHAITRLSLGRHYGDTVCIWCWQVS